MNISRNCLEANSFISGGYGASGRGQKELFIETDRNVPDVTGTAATFLNSNTIQGSRKSQCDQDKPAISPLSIFYPCYIWYKCKNYEHVYRLYQYLMDWTRSPDLSALYRCYCIRLEQDGNLKRYLLTSGDLSYKCEISKWNKVVPFHEFFELLKFKAAFPFE